MLKYAQLKDAANWWWRLPMKDWPPEAFEELGLRNPYEPSNMTIRLEALAATRDLAGSVVQCGVYKGQTLATLAWLMREAGDTRTIFGFDSFCGSPQPSPQDAIDGAFKHFHMPEYWADTSELRVRNFFTDLGLGQDVTLVPGYFEESLPTVSIESISLVILDCDLYESYKMCLRHLWPHVVSGGWGVFDEYFSPKYPGARIAVDQFFADKPEKPIVAEHLLALHPYERWYVVKE